MPCQGRQGSPRRCSPQLTLSVRSITCCSKRRREGYTGEPSGTARTCGKGRRSVSEAATDGGRGDGGRAPGRLECPCPLVAVRDEGMRPERDHAPPYVLDGFDRAGGRQGACRLLREGGGSALAGVLPGLGSCMIRGPYACRLLGQVCPLPAMCPSGPLVLLDAGPGSGRWVKPWSRPSPPPAWFFRPLVGAGGRRRAAPVA